MLLISHFGGVKQKLDVEVGKRKRKRKVGRKEGGKLIRHLDCF